MNKKLVIAGIIGVILFATFILMLILSTGKKDQNTKPIVADKITTQPPPNLHQTQQTNQTIEQQMFVTDIKQKQEDVKIEEKTDKTTEQQNKTKKITKKIKQKEHKNKLCIDHINYLICTNNICKIDGIVCGVVKEVTIDNVIYENKPDE